MAEFVKKGATYADLEAVPEPLAAGMLDGELRRLSLDTFRLAGSVSSDDELLESPFDTAAFPLAVLWPFDKPLGFAERPQHLFVGDR